MLVAFVILGWHARLEGRLAPPAVGVEEHGAALFKGVVDDLFDQPPRGARSARVRRRRLHGRGTRLARLAPFDGRDRFLDYVAERVVRHDGAVHV